MRWLACTLAWLNVDAVALAAVTEKKRSQPALERLVRYLRELTNDTHGFRLDDCANSNGQHLAWLWNEARVRALDFRMHALVAPDGEACAGRSRPGFAANLLFAGGLDLHAIAVHLKSGHSRLDADPQRDAMEGLEWAIARVTMETGDSDVLVLGDVNGVRCNGCAGFEDGADEAMEMDAKPFWGATSLRRIPSDLGCSHYYGGAPELVDHFFVTPETTEVPRFAEAEVEGYCRELACGPLPTSPIDSRTFLSPSAATQLSDHCPIVLTLRDHDWDVP